MPSSIQVSLGPVTLSEAVRHLEVTGSLEGDVETVVASKVRGRTTALHADLGDAIETGATLGTIDPRDYELELAQREATVLATLAQLGLAAMPDATFDASQVPAVRRRQSEADNARARFERAERLFSQTPPLIAEQDLADLRTTWHVARDNAEAELLAAKALVVKARAEQALVEIARQQVSDTTVRAPAGFSGAPAQFRVAERLVSTGEFMTEGTPMFRLVVANPIRFRATVPERFADTVSVGQRATVELESGLRVEGSVARIAPDVDVRSRSFGVEILVPNADHRLKPGGFARGSIEIAREAGVTFVPPEAVVSFAGVDRVFSVRDGKAVAHRVRLGIRQDGLVEIVGGLPVSEIVVTGVSLLSQDTPVTVGALTPPPASPSAAPSAAK